MAQIVKSNQRSKGICVFDLLGKSERILGFGGNFAKTPLEFHSEAHPRNFHGTDLPGEHCAKDRKNSTRKTGRPCASVDLPVQGAVKIRLGD